MEMVLCPACGGAGEVPVPQHRWLHVEDPDIQHQVCPHCAGQEVLPPLVAKSVARRLGWSPSQILQAGL